MATKISDLLIPTSGCGDIALAFDGTRLRVRYEIRRAGKDQIGQVTFTSVCAFRFREEMLSAGFEKGSYDTLVRLPDSDWIVELEGGGPGDLRLHTTNHYAVLFSSNGYLEVAADRNVFLLEAEAKGAAPLRGLVNALEAEARAAGASQLRIVGHAVINRGFTSAVAKRFGFAFRPINAETIELTKELR